MVDNGVGSCSPYLRCVSMAASVISVKKSARQYHCRPSGSSGLNRLWKASNGIGGQTDHQRRTELLDRGERLVGHVVGAGVAPDDAAHPAVPELFREGRTGRDAQHGDPARQLLRQRGQQLPVPTHHVAGVVEIVEDRPGDHQAVLTDLVAAEGEGGDDAEVAAAAPQGPEQVGVRRTRSP